MYNNISIQYIRLLYLEEISGQETALHSESQVRGQYVPKTQYTVHHNDKKAVCLYLLKYTLSFSCLLPVQFAGTYNTM